MEHLANKVFISDAGRQRLLDPSSAVSPHLLEALEKQYSFSQHTDRAGKDIVGYTMPRTDSYTLSLISSSRRAAASSRIGSVDVDPNVCPVCRRPRVAGKCICDSRDTRGGRPQRQHEENLNCTTITVQPIMQSANFDALMSILDAADTCAGKKFAVGRIIMTENICDIPLDRNTRTRANYAERQGTVYLEVYTEYLEQYEAAINKLPPFGSIKLSCQRKLTKNA